jgi:hypothetical protein
MSLIVSEKQLFEVVVRYKQNGDNLLFYENGEKAEEGHKEEKFFFKRPSWSDTRIMMADTMFMDPATGQPILDPYRFMDRKIKTLLKDWTLKQEDGEKLPLTSENIDNLDPALINFLNAQLDGVISRK